MYVDELNFLPPEYDSGLLITALWHLVKGPSAAQAQVTDEHV